MRNLRGSALIVVVMLLMVAAILIPALLRWLTADARLGAKTNKSVTAFNLADAAIDRGLWKIKSTTGTFKAFLDGIPITDYDFDKTFTDIKGGRYRIRFLPGPGIKEVTIIGEGSDEGSKEVRSARAIYRNSPVAGPLISEGSISLNSATRLFWGPVIAMGDITLDFAQSTYHAPRKLAHGVVISTRPGYTRDPNGLDPPNTDQKEWWSDFNVPQIPILDFALLRSSALASGTLNCMGDGKPPSTLTCGVPGSENPQPNYTIHNVYQSPKALLNDVWYWDSSVTMANDLGIVGTTIVQGDLTIPATSPPGYGQDQYIPPPVHVPDAAWQEYAYFDNATIDQYPADTGYRQNASTYQLGSCSACSDVAESPPGSGAGSGSGGDVGFYGFVYVKGKLDMSGACDVYGAVWAKGGMVGTDNVWIFYDDRLDLPTLNITLIRKTWFETAPSTETWH